MCAKSLLKVLWVNFWSGFTRRLWLGSGFCLNDPGLGHKSARFGQPALRAIHWGPELVGAGLQTLVLVPSALWLFPAAHALSFERRPEGQWKAEQGTDSSPSTPRPAIKKDNRHKHLFIIVTPTLGHHDMNKWCSIHCKQNMTSHRNNTRQPEITKGLPAKP